MTIGNAHVIECNGPPLDPPPFVGMHWVDTVAGCHYVSVGTASVNDWIKTTVSESITEVNAPGLTTTTLVAVPLANFCGIDFHICFFNVTEDKWKTIHLQASKKTATTVEHSVIGILAGPLNISANFLVSGSDAILEVANAETFAITARVRSETI